MPLDVEPPDPPTPAIENAEEYEADRYRQEELGEYLEQGAWEEGFSEWTADTPLTEGEYAIARDLELFDDFEFVWDDEASQVEYRAPELPDDWLERNVHPDLDSIETAEVIDAELDSLGAIVADVLTEFYVDWEDERDAFGPQYNSQDDSLSEAEYSDRDG